MYWYLTWKYKPYNSKILLELDFSLKHDNSWELEIGRKTVRLTTKWWDLGVANGKIRDSPRRRDPS